jgi:hypothetical protein
MAQGSKHQAESLDGEIDDATIPRSLAIFL